MNSLQILSFWATEANNLSSAKQKTHKPNHLLLHPEIIQGNKILQCQAPNSYLMSARVQN